jgi:hypothetical protein
MSVIATAMPPGTAPEPVDVKEPTMLVGACAEPVAGGSAHVDGTAGLDESTPAMETPRSYRVLAARPFPEMAVDPPTFATVGLATRLVPSRKSMSPNCVFCVVPNCASLLK